MRKYLLVAILLCFFGMYEAVQITRDEAIGLARAFVEQIQVGAEVSANEHIISEGERLLARVWDLYPSGYIVVSADDALPPVLAYSTVSSYIPTDDNPLQQLLIRDISARLQAPETTTSSLLREKILQGRLRDGFEQWPDPEIYPTEGWLSTTWNQTAPYNLLCPMDPVSNLRSLAGCPAVAMAQILNYHQTLNGTVFDDGDDYLHNYAGRFYHIDDDFEAQGFASWPQLNLYMRDLENSWWDETVIDYNQRAALIFAAGAVAHQVYSSQGSGTFAVSQAYQAILRFGFDSAELLTGDAPDIYDRINSNIMDAYPVLLAVVTPAWDAGHNLVLDGYNTNGYYHCNFGWGGASDGWYLMPAELPYQLSVIEGVVVDIIPANRLFCIPEEIYFQTETDLAGMDFELINTSPEALEITDCKSVFDGGLALITSFSPALPCTIEPGQSLYGSVSFPSPNRSDLMGELRLRHNRGYDAYPVRVNPELLVSSLDPQHSPGYSHIKAYPNPFGSSLTISVDKAGFDTQYVDVFNLRGQRLQRIAITRGEGSSANLAWDGRDETGRPAPSGIYLLKPSGNHNLSVKVLLIRD